MDSGQWAAALAKEAQGFQRFPRSFSVVLFAVSAIFLGGIALTRAEEFASSSGSASRPAAKSNSKLHWLPYREEKVKPDAEVQQVQYTTTMPAQNWSFQQRIPTPAARPAPGGTIPPNTLNEPRSERKATLLPAPPSEMDVSLTEPPVEPKVEDEAAQPTRGLPAEEKAAEPADSNQPAAPADSSKHGASPLPSWSPLNNNPRLNANPSPNDRNGYLGDNLPNTPRTLPGDTEEYHKCTSVKDLKPITKLSVDILTVKGEVPKDCPWGNETRFEGRTWESLTYTWTASALCHKPLYFEDAKLERYGHMWGPWLQPIISHARFFVTVPILPYEMGLEPPHECIYVLGHYRPGSCAPYYLDPIPLSVRAALFEAGAWVGGVAIIP